MFILIPHSEGRRAGDRWHWRAIWLQIIIVIIIITIFIFPCAVQTMLSTELDFHVSVEEVEMHLSNQIATRRITTELLNAKKRMVRCLCLIHCTSFVILITLTL